MLNYQSKRKRIYAISSNNHLPEGGLPVKPSIELSSLSEGLEPSLKIIEDQGLIRKIIIRDTAGRDIELECQYQA